MITEHHFVCGRGMSLRLVDLERHSNFLIRRSCAIHAPGCSVSVCAEAHEPHVEPMTSTARKHTWDVLRIDTACTDSSVT